MGVLQASAREDSYEETIRDLHARLKDVSIPLQFHKFVSKTIIIIKIWIIKFKLYSVSAC